MNINEVRDRKKELEAKIAVEVNRLINDFQKETDANIDNIDLNFERLCRVGYKPENVISYCKITINI